MMEVILCEDIRNLGQIGMRVHVRPGYGRNFLIPQGKALPVTRETLAEFEARAEDLQRQRDERLGLARERAERLGAKTFIVPAKVGVDDKLFGSVGAAEIVQAVQGQGEQLDKSELRLPQGSLRMAGEHAVSASLHPEVEVSLQIRIEAE